MIFPLLHEILNLIADTVCTRRKLIRIASDDKPVEIVRSQFMKLTAEHICYVVDCFQERQLYFDEQFYTAKAPPC